MDILNQFGINPILLAAQVVNFFILLFILKKLLYNPILKVLETRKKKIEDSLKNAEEIELKLQQTNEKVDELLSKASYEGQKILTEAQKMREEIIGEAKLKAALDADAIFKKEQEALRMEKEKMLMEAKSEIADLVMAVFQKVTGKVLSKEEQKDIVEREVKNLS